MYMKKYSRILGRRIKSQREKQLLTATQVASKINVDVETYLKWENGEELPPHRQLNRLSTILRSHTDRLSAGLLLQGN